MNLWETISSVVASINPFTPKKQEEPQRIPMPPPRQDLINRGYQQRSEGTYEKKIPNGTRVIFPEKMPKPTLPPRPVVPQSTVAPTAAPNPKVLGAMERVAEAPKQPSVTPTQALTNIANDDSMGRDPDIRKYTISKEVDNAIKKAAKTHGIPSGLLFDIAKSESGFNPKSNPQGPIFDEAGHPKGLFQFVDHTWDDILNRYNNKPGMSLHLSNTDRFDPETNAMAAAYLIAHGQLGKWTASKHSWGKYWSEEELAPYYSQTLGYRRR